MTVITVVAGTGVSDVVQLGRWQLGWLVPGVPTVFAGATVQGVIKSYDPGTGDGVILSDTDFAEYDLAPGALAGSVFRMLRQGQRVVFDVDDAGRAAGLRLGSEVDMGTPRFPQDEVPIETGP